jgi:hypothetical protein
MHYLGGSSIGNLSARELTAQAALMQMTTEERGIQENCGCEEQSFLPSNFLENCHKNGGDEMETE